MVQLSPTDGSSLALATTAALSLGGAEANVASTLARLGHEVAWASYLGADPLGDLLLGHLRRWGVDTSLVEQVPHAFTGVYFKDPTPSGTTAHYYRAGSAASRLAPDAAERWSAAVQPRVVHVSGVTALISSTAEQYVRAITTQRAFGDAVVSFDVNMRKALATENTPAVLLSLAQSSDIVFVGRDEAEGLWGTVTADDVRAAIPQPAVLVVKDSDREAVSFHGPERFAVPAQRVEVVEATGAGDAFAAGWLSSWLAGDDPIDSLRRGHAMASLALTTHSDVPDDSRELL